MAQGAHVWWTGWQCPRWDEGVGRPITPVAMTVDLYRAGTKYHQEPAKLEENRKLAARLAHQDIEALRDLADEIA